MDERSAGGWGNMGFTAYRSVIRKWGGIWGVLQLPIRSEVDAAKAVLDRRFGGESEQIVAEYCAIWREIQDEC